MARIWPILSGILLALSIVNCELSAHHRHPVSMLLRHQQQQQEQQPLVSFVPSSSHADSLQHSDATSTLRRLIRGAGQGPKGRQSGDKCRYEKSAWDECDPVTGLQRRTLKLKSPRNGRSSDACEPQKTVTRACKKACRYSKGVWSECLNGERHRVDALRISSSSTQGCESTKNITKKCKPACRYSKSEWTPCENGVKSKSLTLIVEANASHSQDCEPTKVLTKPCGQGNQGGKDKEAGKEQRIGRDRSRNGGERNHHQNKHAKHQRSRKQQHQQLNNQSSN